MCTPDVSGWWLPIPRQATAIHAHQIEWWDDGQLPGGTKEGKNAPFQMTTNYLMI